MRLSLIWIFLFFISALTSRAGQPIHITVKNGLPNSTVYHIMQDSKGFLWFCTETGVCRYDGRRFESFTVNQGLADNENFRSFEDSKGRIWFLSYNGKLCYYYNGKMHNQQNTRWLSYNSNNYTLLDWAEDKYGNVWISTWLETIQIRDSTITKHYLGNGTFFDFHLNKSLLTDSGLVKRFIFDSSKYLFTVDLLSGRKQKIGNYDSIRIQQPSFTGGSMKRIYMLSTKGLLFYENSTLKGFDVAGSHGSSTLTNFAEDTATWIGTAGMGMCKVLPDGKKHWYLQGNVVTSILRDRDCNLWVTTLGNGIFLYRSIEDYSTQLTQRIALSVAAMLPNRNVILAGHDNGMITIIKNDLIIDSFFLTDSKYNRILGIIPFKDPNHALLCSDEGVYFFDIQTRTHHYIGAQNYKNHALLGNKVWFATPKYPIILSENVQIKINTSIPYLRLTSIAPISDSVCYGGSTSKLFKINILNHYTTVLSDSVLKAGVKDLKIANGRLWVTTHGNGIFILANDTIWRHITQSNSDIIGDFCEKIYEDNSGSLWIATNKGICVFDKLTGQLRYSLPSGTGLIPNDVKALMVAGDYLFIASADGLFRLKKDVLFKPSVPPNLYITRFINGDELITDPPDKITFAFQKGTVSISFTALAFQEPESIIYEYKFDQENTWHRTQSEELKFVGLKPGTHKLLFRARRYNSKWCSPVSLTMVVKPGFFQSMTFKIAVAVLIAGLIYLWFITRVKHIRKREAEKNEAARRILELESKTLSCQMNPHFIFNSLNTIQQFILVNAEEQGIKYLGEFATLMRQILENSKKPHITLAEEVDFLERYLELEQIRYDNRFSYHIDIEGRLKTDDEIRIPPVMLQPLLENAIKHGISSIKGGQVTLQLRKENNFLVGNIEDNGIGFHQKKEIQKAMNEKKESTALKVLEERLRLTVNNKGERGSMLVIDKHNTYGTTGTIIKIHIPIQ